MSVSVTRVLRTTLGRVVLAVYRTRVEGRDNVPAGGLILAGNHVSYLDPVLLWCAFPRQLHFMAKAELWHSRFLGWAIERLHAFPVHRGRPDRTALVTASSLLDSGSVVGIYPEGTRQRPDAPDVLGEANEGAAFLALRAGVPVVPVGIDGTAKALPRGARLPRFPQVKIVFGEPIDPARFTDGGRKERVGAMTHEIMAGIERARRQAEEA